MLLFGENLPRQLIHSLADLYPDSEHVLLAGMDRADDSRIWRYAAERGRIIVSKDEDFYARSQFLGAPPKFVWLRCGNCSAAHLEGLLRQAHAAIQSFAADEGADVLVIG